MKSPTFSSSPSSASSDSDGSGPKMLHETTSKKFGRAANGKIFTKTFNTIYAMLIICLDLNENSCQSHHQKGKFRLFQGQSFPFSFSIDEGISQMNNLTLSVNLQATSTTISYSLKSDLASSLIKKFMRAKLLHTPADRTRAEPKAGVWLQPTPKGCAIVQNFCRKIGFKANEMPKILHTEFNSMDLICFEKHPETDNIVQSQYLVHLLFMRFLGPKPNIWRADNDPDPLPINKINDLPILDFSQPFDPEDICSFADWNTLEAQKLSSISTAKKGVSPFHHKFFTNPESDSHVQYYVSNMGIRLLRAKEFGVRAIKIDYCFSGKAAVQWFMDCTDIMYPLEAAEIFNLLLKNELIEPILLAPSTSPKSGFSAAADAFYTITSKGLEISQWTRSVDVSFKEICVTRRLTANSAMLPHDLNLKDVLEDPGSRFLLRKYLEQNMCVENLDVYVEISDFNKQMTILKRIMLAKEAHRKRGWKKSETKKDNTEIRKYNKENDTMSTAISRLINDCLSKAYSIHSSYLSRGSPYEINISDDWRNEVHAVLVHPSSPYAETFPRTPTYEVHTDGMGEEDDSEALGEGSLHKADYVKTKGLTLESVKEENADDKMLGPLTPNSKADEDGLVLLERIEPLLKKINNHIVFTLTQDSFPRFVKSELFLQNNDQIRLFK